MRRKKRSTAHSTQTGTRTQPGTGSDKRRKEVPGNRIFWEEWRIENLLGQVSRRNSKALGQIPAFNGEPGVPEVSLELQQGFVLDQRRCQQYGEVKRPSGGHTFCESFRRTYERSNPTPSAYGERLVALSRIYRD